MYIVTHMTPARQRLDKHPLEVMLSTTEGRLKAGLVKSDVHCQSAVAMELTRFRHIVYVSNSSGTLEGGGFYPVLLKL
jgi:hypothetical protein